MKTKLLTIAIPCYNSAAYMEKAIKSCMADAERIEIIIVDDGSSDATAEIADRYAALYPDTIKAVHKENGGHGATVLFGYNYAIENGADYIFQTDSDGQTLPAEFEEFWNLRKDYDMVIGHRKGRQDGFSRVFVTKVLKAVCLLCFHVNVQDANTPFRLMKAESLKKEIVNIPKDYNLANVIVSVLFIKKGYQVKYLPITFRPRQGGVNSINFKKITKIGQKALKDFIRINKIMKASK